MKEALRSLKNRRASSMLDFMQLQDLTYAIA